MPSAELTATVEFLRELSMFFGDISADRAAMAASNAVVPDDVPHESVTVADRAAEWIQAEGADDDAAILYLHGGGYVLGGLDTHGAFAARLSAVCGTRVLLLDYRLGPEHRHPAALDDAVAAVDWLTREAGIDPARIMIAGDSAGGGLTVATLAALRDRGDAAPVAGGIAISPWTDLTLSGASVHTRADADPIVDAAHLATYAAAYADDVPLDDPALSPLFADHAGLPPLLVLVGSAEVLYDDSTRLVERVEKVGGEISLTVYDEAPHVFPMMSMPEADEALAEMAGWVRDRLT